MKNYFTQSALAKVAKMLADKFGLVVKFAGGTPRTDGKTITLPVVSDELPEAKQRDLLAHTVHEVAHILFTEMELATTFPQQHGKKAFELLNAVEDARIERLIEQEYVGAKRLLDGINYKLTETLEQNNIVPDPFRQFASMLYLIGRNYKIPSNWDESIKQKAMTFTKEINDAIKAETTTEVGEIVLKILNVLQKELEAADQSEPNTPDSGDSGGGDDSGSPNDIDQNENNDSMEPGEESGSSSINPNENKGNISARSDTGNTAESDDTRFGTAANVLEMSDTEEPVNPHEMMMEHISEACDDIIFNGDKTQFRRYDSSIDSFEIPLDAGEHRVKQYEYRIRPYVNAVRSKLLSALTAQGQTRWLTHQDDGTIDCNRLPDLITGNSSKIFKTRTQGRSKRTAVTLLIDTSGSMSGDRIQICRSLAMVFSDVLSRANIQNRVIGFDGSGDFPGGQPPYDYSLLCQTYSQVSPVRYTLLKDFNESYQKVKARFPRLSTGGITPLAPALLSESQRLLNQDVDRRIHIVLSDGEPNSDCNISEQQCKTMCRDIISQAERAGVETVGIGIGLDVSSVFSNNVTITELKDLPKEVLRQLHSLLVTKRV